MDLESEGPFQVQPVRHLKCQVIG